MRLTTHNTCERRADTKPGRPSRGEIEGRRQGGRAECATWRLPVAAAAALGAAPLPAASMLLTGKQGSSIISISTQMRRRCMGG
ncbi:unnamed protein product [Pleuronectes platessa]|uniref:Uncharacterized protein n=1 Tax=Pleuronectes platessa TaxID=8262 RepID=A0A9N7YKK4_PLEPL|nr:unnamed protein product [Pleuronectes platessa]